MMSRKPEPNDWLTSDAYRVPRHPAPMTIRLDGNEGTAPSSVVLKVLQDLNAEDLRAYPDKEPLEAAIARFHDVAPNQVLVTAGGDEGLLRMCRAFLSPKKNFVLPEPTFGMLNKFANWCNSPVKSVDWQTGNYPLSAVLAQVDDNTGIIAVVSPNNPTGGIATQKDLVSLSEAAPQAMIMVDCAYAEFADVDLTKTALSLPNTLVFRTFSKAFGLAGLRLGYVLGDASWIGVLRRVGLPYPVSAPSIALAAASLRRFEEREGFIQNVRSERAELREKFTRLGLHAESSQGNFVFLRTRKAIWWRDGLAGQDIGIRNNIKAGVGL